MKISRGSKMDSKASSSVASASRLTRALMQMSTRSRGARYWRDVKISGTGIRFWSRRERNWGLAMIVRQRQARKRVINERRILYSANTNGEESSRKK